MGQDSSGFSNDSTNNQQGNQGGPQSYFDRYAPTPQAPQRQQFQPLRESQSQNPLPNNVSDIQDALRGQFGVLKDHQNTIKTQSQELAGLRQQTSQNSQLMDQLRGVFNPQTQQVDPIDQTISEAEQQMDFYLQQALEADKNGNPIPLTTNLAIAHFKNVIATANEKRDNAKTMAAMRQKLNQLTDPNVQIDTGAYADIDNKITQYMGQLYGNDQASMDVRIAQFNNIAGQIGQEIKNIQKTMPDVWDRVRRNPEERQKLVAYYVEKNMPPRVRQQLEQEHIQNTPMTMDDLYQAFEETKLIQDPKQRADLQARVRQEILAEQFDMNRPTRRGPSGGGASRNRNSLGQFQATRGVSSMYR